MPEHKYRCPACDCLFQIRQADDDRHLVRCPKCHTAVPLLTPDRAGSRAPDFTEHIFCVPSFIISKLHITNLIRSVDSLGVDINSGAFLF